MTKPVVIWLKYRLATFRFCKIAQNKTTITDLIEFRWRLERRKKKKRKEGRHFLNSLLQMFKKELFVNLGFPSYWWYAAVVLNLFCFKSRLGTDWLNKLLLARSRYYQTLFFLVFRFLLLSLSVCHKSRKLKPQGNQRFW